MRSPPFPPSPAFFFSVFQFGFEDSPSLLMLAWPRIRVRPQILCVFNFLLFPLVGFPLPKISPFAEASFSFSLNGVLRENSTPFLVDWCPRPPLAPPLFAFFRSSPRSLLRVFFFFSRPSWGSGRHRLTTSFPPLKLFLCPNLPPFGLPLDFRLESLPGSSPFVPATSPFFLFQFFFFLGFFFCNSL